MNEFDHKCGHNIITAKVVVTKCRNVTVLKSPRSISRPIAGSIAILSAMKYIDYNPGELKRVIIHELGHTFGFDYQLFPYLRHDDGSPRTKRNQHTGEPELSTDANEGLKADRNTIKYVSRTWHTVSGEKTYKRVALTLPSVVINVINECLVQYHKQFTSIVNFLWEIRCPNWKS
ncbi:hypothetical protein MS3_00000417 [Schistosoma haematobium]|uniref:Leishmanolysin-like peptidase n=1 Tax=Schistosoma haematobium TaxID=6185 RepID=A0A922LGQ8_SCHHA|nr:hypothetical protein MS3_00000417 [Schistosoma haematobium]KAH9582962.1 hypothetical protein MS3_00000417 [Schistosoma haematobium]